MNDFCFFLFFFKEVLNSLIGFFCVCVCVCNLFSISAFMRSISYIPLSGLLVRIAQNIIYTIYTYC